MNAEKAIKESQKEAGYGSSGEPLYKVWRCPSCGHHKVKHTAQSKSSRYWPADDLCNNPDAKVCKTASGRGTRTRNILAHVVVVRADRDEARELARQLNTGLGGWL